MRDRGRVSADSIVASLSKSGVAAGSDDEDDNARQKVNPLRQAANVMR